MAVPGASVEDTAMLRITTFLAYDDQAEEAAKFYIKSSSRSPAGPISSSRTGYRLSVECGTQEEVDTYCERLTEGGEPREIEAGHGSDAQDEKDQHRGLEEGIQGMTEPVSKYTHHSCV